MEQLTEVFLTEAADQLDALEDALLALEREPQDTATIHTAFRAAHTIKGSSGMADAHAVSAFTHAVENVLDLMRDGRQVPEPDLITLLLQCTDHMHALVDAFAGGNELDGRLQAAGESLGQRLHPWLTPADAADATPAAASSATAGSAHPPAPAGNASDCWHVSLRMGAEIFQRGVDPVRLIRYLGTLGELVRVVTIDDDLPELDDMDAELSYLGFEIDVRGQLDAGTIEEVFAFVRGDCELTITPPRLCADATPAVEAETPPVQATLAPKADSGNAPRPHGARDHLRVDADKLDKLMDLVGELVIAGAAASALSARKRDAELTEALHVVSRRIEELRESAMQMRMVEIGATFNRFQRVVRDLSHELGKDIELLTTGGETELDKSVVEQISDPLMHLVRNSIDHGIEPAELRRQRGKLARGQVTLAACHEGGGIVIQIRDDGGGLNTDRILAKAIERKLVPANATLGETEIHQLIFEPGFSTADQVTALSGRGVGMDVVRRNIQALRGTVTVDSRAGEGCIFTIRLPLTLAIIDGFRVGVGDAHFVIPLEIVGECIRLTERDSGCAYMTLHGEMLPYVRLRNLFDVMADTRPQVENVVVVQHAGRKVGLVVEHLYGEMQAVIKPMGRLFNHIQGLAGSILLGSGEIALFLDVPALLRGVDEAERAETLVTSHPTRRQA
jgi:two-component system chemotaxis sensor kinase CheA